MNDLVEGFDPEYAIHPGILRAIDAFMVLGDESLEDRSEDS